MDLFSLPIFQRMNERLNWLNARQKVIAQNIANADTPNYVPNDLKPMRFRDQLAQVAAVEPARTAAGHMAGTLPVRAAPGERRDNDTYETAPVGNSVVIEEQMMHLSETQLNYNTVVSLYKKQVDLIRTAIGRNGL